MERDKIVKALECCAERFWMCDECPYENEENCVAEMLSDASDRIRELIEDNEAQAETIKSLLETIKSIQAATVREMSERIKADMNNVSRWSFHNDPNEYFIIGKPLIDQIAKEMLEEDQ